MNLEMYLPTQLTEQEMNVTLFSALTFPNFI